MITSTSTSPARWRRRGDTALRVIAAILGGYAGASLWAMALARLLPGDRSEATIWSSILAFALCAATAMWAFAARSGWRALWTIVLSGAVSATITVLSIYQSGRL